jgi:NMD protein affecting ribosome stability and mRNA decay
MTKALIRSLNRRGSRSEKSPPPAQKSRRTAGPTICKHCGASFVRKEWRTDHKVTMAYLDRAVWRLCPACSETRGNEGFGKVVLRGSYLGANEDAIRRRIANVAARAAHTQPQRRVVTIDRTAAGLEVLTTSQKLAHRIARELKKAFRGRTSYAWSDTDGALFATWERDGE